MENDYENAEQWMEKGVKGKFFLYPLLYISISKSRSFHVKPVLIIRMYTLTGQLHSILYSKLAI